MVDMKTIFHSFYEKLLKGVTKVAIVSGDFFDSGYVT